MQKVRQIFFAVLAVTGGAANGVSSPQILDVSLQSGACEWIVKTGGPYTCIQYGYRLIESDFDRLRGRCQTNSMMWITWIDACPAMKQTHGLHLFRGPGCMKRDTMSGISEPKIPLDFEIHWLYRTIDESMNQQQDERFKSRCVAEGGFPV